jgi:hypothetical protein
MAWMLGDSFDFYTTMNDALPLWTTVGTYTFNPTGPGRFTGSRCVTIPGTLGGTYLTKTGGTNSQTHHLVFAFYLNAALSGTTNYFFATLVDGSTAQCTVMFRSDGAIVFTNGAYSGTVLETFTGGLAPYTWYGIEIEITISNTAGAITIRLNGSTTPIFSATGLNTRTTSDNYANALWLGSTTYGANLQYIDDFLWFTCDGAAPNTWVGDIRAVQIMPDAAGSSTEFSATQTSPFNYNPVTSAQRGLSVNMMTFVGHGNSSTYDIIMSAAASITSIQTSFNAAFTGHMLAAIYDNTGASGGPGNLLGTSNVVTSAAAGATVTFTFPAGVNYVAGSEIFVGFLSDTAATLNGQSGWGGMVTTAVSQAYSSGFPSSLASTSWSFGTSTQIMLSLQYTVVNFGMVSEAQENGDTTYIYDSNPGDNDLYLLPSLATTPSTILAVQTRGYMRKSDTGTRTGALQIKSGTTTAQSGTLTLSTTYQGVNRVDVVDPNTGSAWQPAAVNAVQVGPVVVS